MCAALVTATVVAVALYPSLRTGATQAITGTQTIAARKAIDVVFVLDTTGSMSGLIAAAKEKIWSIASTMAQADQAPVIRMGLVAYRDRGDAYVTRVVDLSSDLDTMYATLMDFAADGGGDTPESVNQALGDAIERISWSQDSSTYRVVFLVGDAPPHMDYSQDRQYPEILAAAAQRGIVVNTIQCGGMPETAQTWTEIARLGRGRYFQVEQSGSALAIATPFDAEIAELSAELDSTRLYYGSEEARAAMSRKVEATDRLHEEASVESRARRGVFNATASGLVNLLGENELVDDVANDRVDLAAIPASELPEPLRTLAPIEQQAAIEGLIQKRAELQGRIAALAGERDQFIADEVAAAPAAPSSLDEQIYETVREQAKAVGLEYTEGPAF
ncbi:MAG TPA: vWA domain-containing protein [Gammaproteobacteria bacterium]